jgi:hypothetical protein
MTPVKMRPGRARRVRYNAGTDGYGEMLEDTRLALQNTA